MRKQNRAQRVVQAIRCWLNRRVLQQRWNWCHDAAYRICTIGRDWDVDTQRHLDQAKDHLYQAARRFDKGHASRQPPTDSTLDGK